MTRVTWDGSGQKRYETGVDRGVLYIPNSGGVYDNGYAWNGLVSVTESPSGAEASPQYADNIKYLNMLSAEEFGATLEAFTYPDEFAQCDGTATPTAGVAVGQQNRKTFGLSYRTKVGNDLNSEAGYKLHLVYNALAAPSEKAYTTMNESPEAITFSWEITTTPMDVTGYKPTALLTIDSTKVNAAALSTLEDLLYGTAGTNPSLPTPDTVLGLFSGTVNVVEPTAPTYNATTKVITIPSITGVIYSIDGVTKTGVLPAITADTIVKARPAVGYKFPLVVDDDWLFEF